MRTCVKDTYEACDRVWHHEYVNVLSVKILDFTQLTLHRTLHIGLIAHPSNVNTEFHANPTGNMLHSRLTMWCAAWGRWSGRSRLLNYPDPRAWLPMKTVRDERHACWLEFRRDQRGSLMNIYLKERERERTHNWFQNSFNTVEVLLDNLSLIDLIAMQITRRYVKSF